MGNGLVRHATGLSHCLLPTAHCLSSSVHDRQDIAAVDDEVLLAVELEFGAAPLGEDDAVTGLDVEGDALAVVVEGALADGQDGGELGLLGGGLGEVDAGAGDGLGLVALNQKLVVEGADADFGLGAGLGCGCHGDTLL